MNKRRIIFFIVNFTLIVGAVFELNIVNKILYPIKYKAYVEKYSDEYNLDKYLVYSIIKAESKFDEEALSHRGAKGLMQISEVTKNWALKELKINKVDIYNPETNIMIGCWYLRKLYNEFDNPKLVIAAYNGGSGNVKKWLRNENFSKDGNKLHKIPFDETSRYVDKVNQNYTKYKEIYRQEGRD